MNSYYKDKTGLIKSVYITFYFKFFSLLSKVISVLMIVTILIVFLTLILNKTTNLNFAIFAIESESMEPELQKGDLIIVQRSNFYYPKEIVTYKPFEEENKSITHRIVSTDKDSQQNNFYRIKGDNNPTEDPSNVYNNMIIGKVIYKIPQLGYGVLFIRTVPGVISLLIIPATMLFTINAYDLFILLRRDYDKFKLY